MGPHPPHRQIRTIHRPPTQHLPPTKQRVAAPEELATRSESARSRRPSRPVHWGSRSPWTVSSPGGCVAQGTGEETCSNEVRSLHRPIEPAVDARAAGRVLPHVRRAPGPRPVRGRDRDAQPRGSTKCSVITRPRYPTPGSACTGWWSPSTDRRAARSRGPPRSRPAPPKGSSSAARSWRGCATTRASPTSPARSSATAPCTPEASATCSTRTSTGTPTTSAAPSPQEARLKIAFYLDELDADSGALRVMPGTNHLGVVSRLDLRRSPRRDAGRSGTHLRRSRGPAAVLGDRVEARRRHRVQPHDPPRQLQRRPEPADVLAPVLSARLPSNNRSRSTASTWVGRARALSTLLT